MSSVVANIENTNTACISGKSPNFNCQIGTFLIKNCQFTNNTAKYDKSGLLFISNSGMSASIIDSVFSDNWASNYPGAKGYSPQVAGHFYIDEAYYFLIDNCIFNSYSADVMDSMLSQLLYDSAPDYLNISANDNAKPLDWWTNDPDYADPIIN